MWMHSTNDISSITKKKEKKKLNFFPGNISTAKKGEKKNSAAD